MPSSSLRSTWLRPVFFLLYVLLAVGRANAATRAEARSLSPWQSEIPQPDNSDVISLPPPSPELNFTALLDGSLGDLPVDMLLLDGVLVEMRSTNTPSESAPEHTPNDAATTQNTENGAVVGSTLGSALSNGL